MKQAVFNFDQAVIEDAVARIQNATDHVGSLRGLLPQDVRGLGLLRQQVEELRRGLIVLTALADALQDLHEQQTAHHAKAAAWISRSARGREPG